MEQGRRVSSFEHPAELRAQMRGRQEIGFERGRLRHGLAGRGCGHISRRHATLSAEILPRTGDGLDGRADHEPHAQGRRPLGRVGGGGIERRHRRDGFDGVGVELEELADDDIRFEADGVGVGTDEGAAKDPRRPVRDVVAFQCVEQGELDFRLLGDRDEGNLLFFALPRIRAPKLEPCGTLRGRKHTPPHAITINFWKIARDSSAGERSLRSLGRGGPAR